MYYLSERHSILGKMQAYYVRNKKLKKKPGKAAEEAEAILMEEIEEVEEFKIQERVIRFVETPVGVLSYTAEKKRTGMSSGDFEVAMRKALKTRRTVNLLEALNEGFLEGSTTVVYVAIKGKKTLIGCESWLKSQGLWGIRKGGGSGWAIRRLGKGEYYEN